MKCRIIIIFLILVLGYSNCSFSQGYRIKRENFFGIEFKPLIPFGLVGDKPVHLKKGNFKSTVTPIFGYSYGGVVRVGLTKLLALETGINYTRRNYRVNYSVPDSSISAKDELGFISFEIPINLLIYIQLGKRFYMNVSGGASGNFNPSNIRSQVHKGKHQFIFEGKRLHFFDFNANANIGFEYRTEHSGIFYLGISARIPFEEKLLIATEYKYDVEKKVSYGFIKGATFAFNIKYFFHNVGRKRGPQPVKGPIE